MIQTVAETGSTNADLAARLRQGEQLTEGYWLLADRQTSGRGRQGRPWSDGAGNFMGSTLVKVLPGDPPPASLALMAGLALYETVLPHIALPQQLLLKWPNDLLLLGAKLSGILLEREGDHVVIGIGVNLAQAPEQGDRETIALSRFGPAPDRDTFAEALAECFAGELDRWRRSGLDALLSRWQAAAHPVGTALAVHDPSGARVAGNFDGLEPDGSMRLRLADGTLRAIHAGDVMLQGK